MFVRSSHSVLLLSSALLVSACAHPGTRPDDMSEAEHLRKAALHRQEAAKVRHEAELEARPRSFPLPTEDYRWTSDVYDPYGNDLRARRLELAAEQHRAAARALRSFEEASCKDFEPTVRATCPLVRGIASLEETDRGVRLVPFPGIDLDVLVAHMRCHAAFGRARAYQGMSFCPLYLPKVEISKAGGAILLEADDAKTREALIERAERHLHGVAPEKGE